MDPHRNSYPDEPEPRRYRGEQQYAEPGAHARAPLYPDETGYRVPDRRSGGRMMPPGPPSGVGSPMGGLGSPLGQWAAEPMPSPMTDTHSREPMQHREPTGMTRDTPRPVEPPPGTASVSVSDSIHRAGRPAAAVVIWIPALVLMLPVLRVLLVSAVGPSLSAGGVISSVLVLLGLPLAALGLYGLATGAARVPDTPAPYAWLRPPVAYLPIALALFVAAGLAAS